MKCEVGLVRGSRVEDGCGLCTCTGAHSNQNSSMQVVFFSNLHMGSSGPYSKCLYPLSHLASPLLSFEIVFKIIICLCGCFVSMCVCASCTCPQRSEEGVWFPATRVTDDYKLMWQCWDSNPCPLEE